MSEEKVEVQESDLTPGSNYEIHIHDHRLYQMTYFILGIIEVFLAFRFFFKLVGANPSNAFAGLVYFVSGILMFPFGGLFGNPAAGATARGFDPSILVAMVVYVILAFFAAKLILIMRSKPTKDK